MRTYVYGKPHDTRDLFEDYLNPGKTAIVSIDMHRGHLDPSPQCPCPAPRAREIRDQGRQPQARAQAQRRMFEHAEGLIEVERVGPFRVVGNA